MDIKGAIRKRGYTQKSLAEALGMTRTSLHAAISGDVTTRTMRRVAQVLGCKVVDFYEDEIDDMIGYHVVHGNESVYFSSASKAMKAICAWRKTDVNIPKNTLLLAWAKNDPLPFLGYYDGYDWYNKETNEEVDEVELWNYVPAK